LAVNSEVDDLLRKGRAGEEMSMRNLIKKVTQATLSRFGLRLIRTNSPFQQSDGLIPFFLALKGLGFDPTHVIDVGANRGNWTREALKFFPNAYYTLVEPQDNLRSYSADLVKRGHRVQWVNCGVSDRAGTLAFTVFHRDEASSFVPDQDTAKGDGNRQIHVAVKTLNELVASGSAGLPDMVKIDAEGFDLKVLSGASDLLGKTEIFLIEATIFGSKYENTLSAVMEKMSNSGYRMIDITALNRSPKTWLLWLCEVAFIRNGSRLLEGAELYE
jgi:FkbM family methyltransferase